MLPIDRKSGHLAPVYVPTYSGPDSPSVSDSWRHSTYNQFLAQQGFIVLQVNVRSASGRGQKHTGMAGKGPAQQSSPVSPVFARLPSSRRISTAMPKPAH